jgi:hypothetical protein
VQIWYLKLFFEEIFVCFFFFYFWVNIVNSEASMVRLEDLEDPIDFRIELGSTRARQLIPDVLDFEILN